MGERRGTDGFGELVRVSAKGVDVPDRCRRSAVAEEHCESVDAFLVIVVEAVYC
jgi:hypothetical protein